MPVIIPEHLPARETLLKENIFVMKEKRALHQDIRPMKIAIVNLMPTKIETETQLLRLIGNTSLQVEVVFVKMGMYESKNTSKEHLATFYQTFDSVKSQKFDGIIITGAPVEHMEFEEVDYWKELTKIMDYAKKNGTCTLFICWAAQAGLYYHYGIKKRMLTKKKFGVFAHQVHDPRCELVRGFDDIFYAPHSRHTENSIEDIQKVEDLNILASSQDAGAYIVASKNGRQIFVTGHSEYDPYTLKKEYERDIQKGSVVDIPKNYFKDDDPKKDPVVRWRGHAHLMFSNWLNYYVYQKTPYDLNKIQ